LLEQSDDAQLKNVLFGIVYLRLKQENLVWIKNCLPISTGFGLVWDTKLVII
jgi:hypothetical protein